jgi:hypothetical protein
MWCLGPARLCTWFRFLWCLLAQEECSKTLDCCHLVRWCLLDSFYGIWETARGLQYAIGGCYGWDRDRMMLVLKHICDAFTSRVFHDDTNATVVGSGMGEVPCFGGMITPGFASVGFLMHQDLRAEQCHWCGIKQEGPFQCPVG